MNKLKYKQLVNLLAPRWFSSIVLSFLFFKSIIYGFVVFLKMILLLIYVYQVYQYTSTVVEYSLSLYYSLPERGGCSLCDMRCYSTCMLRRTLYAAAPIPGIRPTTAAALVLAAGFGRMRLFPNTVPVLVPALLVPLPPQQQQSYDRVHILNMCDVYELLY